MDSWNDSSNGPVRSWKGSVYFMQALQHDGDHSSLGSQAGTSEGLYQDPNRVTRWCAYKPGWTEFVATATSKTQETVTLPDGTSHVAHFLHQVRLGHAAGMMLLQGANFSQLFDGCSLKDKLDKESVFTPLLLSMSSFPNILDPTLQIQRVVLAEGCVGKNTELIRQSLFNQLALLFGI